MFSPQVLARTSATSVVVLGAGLDAQAAIIWDFNQSPNGQIVTIQEINDAGGLQVGDKLFTEFVVSTAANTSNTLVVPAADSINVQGLQTGPNEFGIAFNSAWQVEPGEFLDTTLLFKVEAEDPFEIIGNTLEIAGTINTTNLGSLSVSETVFRENPLEVNDADVLAIKQVFFVRPPNNFDLSDTQAFLDPDTQQLSPEKSVYILKDILLEGGAFIDGQNDIGVVGLSFVKQTFAQTPEPGSLALVGIGALAAFRRRRA